MASVKERHFYDFAGGMNPRVTPILLSNMKGGIQSPDMRNCDFFYPASVQKRLGKAYLVEAAIASAPTEAGDSASSNYIITATVSNNIMAIGKSFVAANSGSVYWGNSGNMTLTYTKTPTWIRMTLRADNSGTPGALIATSSNGIVPLSGSEINLNKFYFVTPPAITAGTTYWIFLEINNQDISNVSFSGKSANTTPHSKITLDNYSTYTDANYRCAVALTLTGEAYTIQGLYDYKYGANATQIIMAANNGSIFYNNAGTWQSLKSSLGAGQNNLFDFETFKDRLFSCDYGQNIPQVWDAAATSTMPLGYRMSPYYGTTGNITTISSLSGNTATFANAPGWAYVGDLHKVYDNAATKTPQYLTVVSVDQTAKTVTYDQAITSGMDRVMQGGFTSADAAGGSVAAGTYRIMAVTKLRSGGYRASLPVVHVSSGGSKKIALTNIAMNSSTDGTQFAFEVDPAATTWFMTLVNATTYYKIPAANIETLQTNPVANNTTGITITAAPAGTENTTDLEYNLPQSYFTQQIGCPKFRYLKVFQNMLVGATGTDNYLYFSELQAPHIWSTYGGYQGNKFPLDDSAGEQITGFKVRNGRLYTGRNRSWYTQSYTGNNQVPFVNERMQGDIGLLSHWSIQETDKGIVFLSQQGPAICWGSYITLIPGAEKIINLFEANDSGRFNLSSTKYSTSFNKETKKQIGWGVSSVNATIRDLVLMYDYEKNIFWLSEGTQSNYFARITDSNGTARACSGSYDARTFIHDIGLNDASWPISWYFKTPPVSLVGVGRPAMLRNIKIFGDVQSSGTLLVDLFIDQSTTPICTYSFDMTSTLFSQGVGVPVDRSGYWFQLQFRNAELNVPVKISGMTWFWQEIGSQI